MQKIEKTGLVQAVPPRSNFEPLPPSNPPSSAPVSIMDKSYAIYRLGGSPESAARWLRLSIAAFAEWPEHLLPHQLDRVLAAILRRETAKALRVDVLTFFSDYRCELVLHSTIERVALSAVLANLQRPIPNSLRRKTHERLKERIALDGLSDRPAAALSTVG
jgi:hypothetical protein